MAKIKVTIPGEEYLWDPDDMMLSEQRLIESELPKDSFSQFLDGIDERRADECQVLVWFLRRKAGNQMDRHAVDFPIRRLTIEVLPEAIPDPEAPAGSEPATS